MNIENNNVIILPEDNKTILASKYQLYLLSEELNIKSSI